MGRRRTILIVDDSRTLLEVLDTAFSDAGYEVATAADGEEVLRKLASSEPDALLLDVYMPRLNGADVCRVVKAHPHWKKIHLVIMSSRVSDEEAASYRRLGADEVLRKPFDVDELVRSVAKRIGAAAM
jgi:twitching motility two-component system response regulator PilG/twitching motility two-component system response regulator PilH